MSQALRGAAVGLVQQLLDDTAGKLWATSNIQLVMSGVVDELWGELLDSWPYLRSTESLGLSLNAPGYVDTDAQLVRFHRLQSLVRDSRTYVQADPRDVVIANNEQIVAPDRTYAFYGNQLHVFPYESTPVVYVRYTSLPTAVTDLASDATAIVWPDGYHMAYIYETAARCMEKGDREKSDTFTARAQQVMTRLKAKLRKQSTGPIMPFTLDSGRDWGGV